MGYRKQQYVYDRQHKPLPIVIRQYTDRDFAQLIDVQRECFPPPFPEELWWNEVQLASHLQHFPQGAICVEDGRDGRIIASVTALRTRETSGGHAWAEATDEGYIRNHDPNGDILYIVDISVRPDYRGWGLGKLLMQTMYETVIFLGIRRLLGGGRMSGYHRYANQLSADAYLQQVVEGQLYDPVITFLLRCGRMPVRVVANYLEDEESCHYGALLKWDNPFVDGVK